jgi:hypothetical protein
MNTFKYIFCFLAILILLPIQTEAQDQIVIPLTNPGEPGRLSIGIVRGSISVSGYDGEEVLVSYGNDSEEDNEQEVTKNGLRRISNNSVGFEASEEDNEVEVSSSSPMRNINFDITVPHNFSLELSTVNGGNIIVENVEGEMEISNVNGEVILRNVSGSALVNTVNGDIEATFQKVSPNKPMAFSNLNGDISVSLPANTKMSAKMKSEWGEVFTDFEMDIRRSNNKKVNAKSKNGTYNVSVNNWIYGDINGGGPEYLFKSMRGDIYIRQQ